MKERPTVKVSKAGVSYVSPADVMGSRVGQAQIQKTIRSNIYSRETGVVKGGSTAGAPARR